MSKEQPAITASVVSILAATPTTIYTVPTTTPVTGQISDAPVILVGITATHTGSPGESAQLHLGILLSLASSWDGEIVAPSMSGGDVFSWSGAIRLEEGDAVQAYASVASVIDVTLETQSYSGVG